MGASRNSSAPISVVPLNTRGSPSKSLGPFAGSLAPWSIVGEPGAWWKSPDIASRNSGACAVWFVADGVTDAPAPSTNVDAKFEWSGVRVAMLLGLLSVSTSTSTAPDCPTARAIVLSATAVR